MTFATPTPAGGWRNLRPGTRVVVRRRLPPAGPVAPDGGADPGAPGKLRSETRTSRGDGGGTAHRWTDLIGYVVDVSDAGLRLRTDPVPGRGEPQEVSVAALDIEAAKPIPPRPARRAGSEGTA